MSYRPGDLDVLFGGGVAQDGDAFVPYSETAYPRGELYDDDFCGAYQMPAAAPVRAELCRRHLRDFVREAWSVLDTADLQWAPYLDVICDTIEELIRSYAEGKPSRNAVINIPPGTGKSRIISVMAPSWAWIQWPHLTFMCLSANPRVALRDADYMRELVTSDWYTKSFRITWTINRKFDARGLFKNTAKGARYSQGLSAKVTGERADIQLIDDPHDASDAMSEVKRKGTTTRYLSTIRNRMNNLVTAVRILVMQRLHDLDLAGVLLKLGWESLCLPMLYEPDHPHVSDKDPRIEKGQCLHPDRYPKHVLDDEQRSLGSYGWAGQMQQRPSPDEGGIFKRKHWRWWRPDGTWIPKNKRPDLCSTGPAIVIPRTVETIMSVDAAFKKTETSDNVAILIGKRTADNRRFIVDVFAERVDFVQTCNKIVALRAQYPEIRKVLIEEAANGAAIMNLMRNVVSGMIPIRPDGGKISRAMAASPSVEAGEVYLLDGEPWVEPFVDEHAAFPFGAKDDRVDAFTQLLNYWYGDASSVAISQMSNF